MQAAEYLDILAHAWARNTEIMETLKTAKMLSGTFQQGYYQRQMQVTPGLTKASTLNLCWNASVPLTRHLAGILPVVTMRQAVAHGTLQ